MFRLKLENFFVFIIFVLLVDNIVYCDLCDLCKCEEKLINNNESNENDNNDSNEQINNLFLINCKLITNGTSGIDFKTIVWPRTNYSINANFNHLDISTLPKIPRHLRVTSLNFDNNSIELIDNEAFQYFVNIEILSLSNNDLSFIKKDMLKNLKQLKELNLSNNKLTEIESSIFDQTPNLELIDLSYNKFNKLSTDLLNALYMVKKINLEGNKLFTIDSVGHINNFYKFEELNLSRNKFTLIPSTLFNNFKLLKSINISFNAIINIDSDAFIGLGKLKTLDISNNVIEDVQLTLPDSIEVLSLKNNQIKVWPLNNLPENFIILELQNNYLLTLNFQQDTEIHLKELNVSNNRIEFIPSANYNQLKIFDISSNELKVIPENLSNDFPSLDTLILDNNLIEKIEFVDKITLKHLSINHLPNLISLDSYAFTNIVGRRLKQNGNGTCVDISVSHCPQLKTIDPMSFYDVNLCKLDLSYNNLINLPSDLFTDWGQFEDGLNIQGNPFTCDCAAQWMLDKILISIYEKKEHQYLLQDLKCAAPGHFTGQRFIKFYKHIGAFCHANAKMRMDDSPVMTAGIGRVDSKESSLFKLGRPNFITIIIGSAVILITLILFGIYLTIEQNKQLKRRNRRFENHFI